MKNGLGTHPAWIRIFESLVPFTSWAIITLPLWLSFFHPAVVAYLIIAFDFYFFYKSAKTVYYAGVSYKQILLAQKVSWKRRVTAQKGASDIEHFVLIPNFKESLTKLKETLTILASTDYPWKKITIVLAFEDREEVAREKAHTLKKEFGGQFKEIIDTYHILTPHEVPGKASNQTHAAQIVNKLVEERGLIDESVLITVCDADSQLPKNYFSYLTYAYLQDKGRKYHFYWAPVLLYNNFWRLPFFVRMQATLSSILRLAFLSFEENLIHISTYSTNLWLLKKINFWDTDIIPEDWHVYFQAFFTFGEKIKTIPLFTIINADAVYSGGVFKTLVNRYEQEKRWAWGVSDIGYSIGKFFVTPHIPAWTKLKKIFFLMETHLFWPVSFFILTVFASIPALLNPVFKRTVLGFLLPQLSSIVLTLASLMLLVYVYLDVKLRGSLKSKTETKKLPLLIMQWYLLPIVSFILSALPALEAHTRIIFGKKLTYKVTEKV